MQAGRIAGAALLIASLLKGETFSLTHFAGVAIKLRTTLTFEGKSERLIASATNETGRPILSAKICILSSSLKEGCLFELWNTLPWPSGEELSWDVTTPKKVADLTHDATIVSLQWELQSSQLPAAPLFSTRPPAQPAGISADILTNETLTTLTKASLGDDVIIAMVNTQPGDFIVSPTAVIALKNSGVSDRVIAAVVNRKSAQLSEPVPFVPEVGVYYQKATVWLDLKPEVVDRKTGGVVKNVASLGIVKGDINGLVNGPSSPTIVQNPVELLIFCSEGVAATEYQLVSLHEHENRREFRTITGGVFHESEGTSRDLIGFQSRKIAPRLYRVTPPLLAPGEYGILPPNSEVANRAAASLGKIYTFRVSE